MSTKVFERLQVTADMAVNRLLELVQLSSEENLLLVGDESTRWAVDELSKKAQTTYMLLEEQRPLTEVPDDLKEALREKNVLVYIISKAGSEERVFRDKLNTCAEELGVRVGNLMDVNPQLLDSAFREDPSMIKEFTLQLLDRMQLVREVRVTSPAGSNFVVEFDKKYSWLASTGFIEFKKTRNLMPAEIYTHPACVEGTIVIDGAYAGLVGYDDSEELLKALKKNPITWVVKNNRIVEIRCAHKRIREITHREVFEKDSVNGNRIGEFGMGTNLGMKELFGNVMHDEKFPGVHIAHGHGYASATGAEYESSVHSDAILLEVSVQDVDSKEYLMRKGKYQKSS